MHVIIIASITLRKKEQNYAAIDGLDPVERWDATLFLAKLSLLRSCCSFNLEASSFWYSAASDFALTIRFFFSAILWRFLCKVNGVTSLWIFGALLCFLPRIKIDKPFFINYHNYFLNPIWSEVNRSILLFAALKPILDWNIIQRKWRLLTWFRCKSPTVHVNILSDIILLGKIEQFSNLWSPLGPSHPRLFSVSQTREIIFSCKKI